MSVIRGGTVIPGALPRQDGRDVAWLQASGFRRHVFSEFRSMPLGNLTGGAAASGATGAKNTILDAGAGIVWEQVILGAGQTIILPVLTANGWDIGGDQTNTEGYELVPFGNFARSPLCFTIGTDAAFFLRLSVKIADASGCDPFLVGFRKQEAYQAVETAYADHAAIGLVGAANPSAIKIRREAGGAGHTDTDTTQTFADGETHSFEVRVSAAGAVKFLLDGAAPTVDVTNYSFTNALAVVPFLYFLNSADLCDNCELVRFECGLQPN